MDINALFLLSGLLAVAQDGSETSGFSLENLFYVIAGLACILVLPRILKKSKRPVTKVQPVREAWNQREEQLRSREAADKILVELVETSREISARMDTKIRILNTLLRDAERSIARLEELHGLPISKRSVSREMEAKNESSAVLSELKNSVKEIKQSEPTPMPTVMESKAVEKNIPAAENVSAAANTGRDEAEKVKHKRNSERLFSGKAEEEKKHLTIEEKAALRFGSPETELAEPAPSNDNLEDATRRQVLGLLSKGYSVPEIARMAGISRQEVTLIEHLHSRV